MELISQINQAYESSEEDQESTTLEQNQRKPSIEEG